LIRFPPPPPTWCCPPICTSSAVERFLSSVADYEAAIPALAPAGAAPPPAPTDPRAALLRLAAASPRLAPPLLGGRALIAAIHAQRVLPTGCDAIDDLLHVGLREGTVCEVAGETSSGKTQLCLQAAAMRALHGERVLYVDTTNGFSAARAARLSEAQHAAIAAEAAAGEVRAAAAPARIVWGPAPWLGHPPALS
jgi:RAD51-like protein 3